MAYRTRVIDSTLDTLLGGLPALAIEGAKAVGKTATASRRASTVLSMDDPRSREVVSAHPDVVSELETPVFIDEWQLEPSVWDAVKRAVDSNPEARGHFLLAGSSGLGPDVRIHSGAGRIVRVTMRPLSFLERNLSEPGISLADLFEGQATVSGESPLELGDYVDEILRSGFPGIRHLEGKSLDAALDSYLARIVDSDLPELGFRVRRPATLTAWLRAYAAATSTSTHYSKIVNAAQPDQADMPSKPTAQVYREHLRRLFILDPLEPWVPGFSPVGRLSQAVQHHLVDPALAARLVGVQKEGLLSGAGDVVASGTGSWLGALFQSLAVQSLRVYAESLGFGIGHLRLHGGEHEVDIILEGENRDVLGIEIKLSPTVSDRDVRHLHWLRQQIGPRMRDAIVVTTGRFAYRREDGIAVIPLALLCP